MIPCHNEGAHIAEIVRAVQVHLPRVIVVDDGSTDDTAGAACKAGAEVIRVEKNSGKGRALRLGWEHASKCGFQWVLMLDGDAQHAPGDIPAFFARAESSAAPLVIGNRMLDTSAMPWLRRMVNRWMSGRISRMVRTTVPDSQCGFRLARLDCLLSLPILANRFEVESAMLTAFIRAGHIVEFVPVQTIYRATKSRIHPVTDTWRWLRWRLSAPAG